MTTKLIDLSKKARVSLEKKNLLGETFQVKFVLDISGSMSGRYSSGIVQELTERMMGIAMNMDKDQSIDVYAFGNNAHRIGTVTPGNIEGYVKREITNKKSLEGGTKYAEVMAYVAEDATGFKASAEPSPAKSGGFFGGLFGGKKEQPKETLNAEPNQKKETTVVYFVTDGENSDRNKTEQFMRDVAGEPIFWQFIGLGNAGFGFLQKLDDLTGRVIDNADFFHANDISKISDEELYDRILTELPSWLKEARQKNIIS